MDAMSFLYPALIVVLIIFIIALVALVARLMKTLQITNDTLSSMKEQLDPTMENVKTITTDIQPTIRKIEPIVDRVQLTLDSVNLEMMRVDEILADVTKITDSAASATNAVETVTSAPVKAVSGVATKVRERFGSKNASEESAQLTDQREAVAKALEEYKAAEEAEEKSAEKANYVEVEEPAAADPEPEPEPEPVEVGAPDPDPEADFESAAEGDEKPYRVIDPEVLENSPRTRRLSALFAFGCSSASRFSLPLLSTCPVFWRMPSASSCGASCSCSSCAVSSTTLTKKVSTARWARFWPSWCLSLSLPCSSLSPSRRFSAFATSSRS